MMSQVMSMVESLLATINKYYAKLCDLQVEKVERFKKTRSREDSLHAKYSLSKSTS